MKKIFIICFQPFISRNILNAGVLTEFLRGGAQVVVFVPKAKEEYFKINFPDVEIIGIDLVNTFGRVEKIFKRVSDLLLDTNTKRFHKLIEYKASKSFFKYIFTLGFSRVISHIPGIRSIFRFLDYWCNNPHVFDTYINQYRPDVVFAPNIFGDQDVVLLKNAKRLSVKTIGMVLSWDNNTSKTLQRVVPDLQIVQNEVIAEESVALHSISTKIIQISGIAHYDQYIDYKPTVDREDFFKRVGLNPNKKTVLVSPAGDKFVETDWQILDILQKALSQGEFGHDVQFLVRIHPTNKVSLGNFIPGDNFVIENPGISFASVRSKDNELDRASIEHLKNTLYHVDVVINTLSSLVIDAAVFNKPIITIGFNGYSQVPFEKSVQLYLEEENMAKLLSIGATPIAYNQHDLIQYVSMYLSDPLLHSEERARLVKQQCWKLDGKSAMRVAEYIFN